MDILLGIFIRVILPVAVMTLVGYVAARLLPFDLKSLARLGLYVLVPCMTFTAMARTTLSATEFAQILLLYALSIPVLWGVSALSARALRLDAGATSAFHISILFTNCVNVGFPVLALAYGADAVERGVVYSIGMQVLLQSLGVYLAARGKTTLRASLTRMWRMPGLWALVAGLAVNAAHITIPPPIFEPLKLIGDSLVSFLLLVLGMQLASVSLRGQWRAATVATVIRLGVAPVVSVALAGWLGLSPLTRQATILENSMPTAIFGVALAQEFDVAPELITTIIFLTTLASMFSLTILIAVL